MTTTTTTNWAAVTAARAHRTHRARTAVTAVARFLAAFADIVCAGLGAACILTAVTVLAGWPWALLALGLLLIALALVVPTWD